MSKKYIQGSPYREERNSFFHRKRNTGQRVIELYKSPIYEAESFKKGKTKDSFDRPEGQKKNTYGRQETSQRKNKNKQ
jgi:hypothetical protein